MSQTNGISSAAKTSSRNCLVSLALSNTSGAHYYYYFLYYHCLKAKFSRKAAIWSNSAISPPEAERMLVNKARTLWALQRLLTFLSQSGMNTVRKKKYQDIVICGKKILVKKPSRHKINQLMDGRSFVHIQHVELRNIYSVKITETRNNKLFTSPAGSLTTGTIIMKSKFCSENIVHTHRVVLVNWR